MYGSNFPFHILKYPWALNLGSLSLSKCVCVSVGVCVSVCIGECDLNSKSTEWSAIKAVHLPAAGILKETSCPLNTMCFAKSLLKLEA